jgi:hypothetical protein
VHQSRRSLTLDCPAFAEREIRLNACSTTSFARQAGRTTDFGDITAYHRHESSRYYALAQAARDAGDLSKAEYMVAMAARHAEAAHEQQMAMMLDPGPSIANPGQRSRWPAPQPEPSSIAPGRLLAVLRGAGHIATAIHKSVSKRNAPFQGLSLR